MSLCQTGWQLFWEVFASVLLMVLIRERSPLIISVPNKLFVPHSMERALTVVVRDIGLSTQKNLHVQTELPQFCQGNARVHVAPLYRRGESLRVRTQLLVVTLAVICLIENDHS